MPLLIAIGLVLIAVIWLIASYNGLVRARQQTRNAWSQIDVQLKRRHDLIPNLVETVKGYMQHERSTLEAVVHARQTAIAAKTVAEHGRAESELTASLHSLFALSESYPELRSNENMLKLQEELASTENRIGFARQHYNDSVAAYNTSIEQFPNSVAFKFTPAEYLEIQNAAERDAVQVKF